MKLSITKEFNFDAAHKLWDNKLTVPKNFKIFGKCVDLHGHTYKLFVTVSSDQNELENGMVMNFSELKKIVNELIIKELDHKYLNEVSWLKDRVTTCENIIESIWERLESELKERNIILTKLELYETPTSKATLELG